MPRWNIGPIGAWQGLPAFTSSLVTLRPTLDTNTNRVGREYGAPLNRVPLILMGNEERKWGGYARRATAYQETPRGNLQRSLWGGQFQISYLLQSPAAAI